MRSPSLDQSLLSWWSYGSTPFNHGRLSAKRVTNDVLQWIDTHRDNPFYLYVHYMDVHSPYDGKWYPLFNSKIYPLQNRKEKFVNIYDGRILYVDTQIHRIWEYLTQTNLSQNTLLIITSDHGEEFFDHDRRGHSFTLYDELIKVPLLMICDSIPGLGRRVARQVQLLDLPITVLDFLGIEAPEQIEGQPLIPLSSASPHLKPPYALSYTSKGQNKRKTEKGKIVRFNNLDNTIVLESLRVGNEWKIILGSDGQAELYNLQGDANEKNNLHKIEYHMLNTLRETLLEYSSPLKRYVPKKEKHVLSPDAKSRLKALGYIK